MAKCPSCNKFAALTFEEPELQSLELSGDTVSAEVRIVRNSECCGDEMKEATLTMEEQLPDEIVNSHSGDGHELSVEEGEIDQIEEGGGRYAKSYFGASVTYSVHCTCQEDKAESLHEGTLSDKVAASQMDELN